MSKFGIDVSEYQGIINWDKVKSQIDFAILRLGWIGNVENRIDKQFERNYKECKRLKIPIGCYIYNYCVTSQNVENNMNWIAKQLKGKSFEMPIYIDMEEEKMTGLGKTRLTEIAIYFCDEISKKGFLAGVYANRNWFDNYLNALKIKNKYNTWIAHYINAVDKYKNEYDMWQAGQQKINGIIGKVDINYLYKIYKKSDFPKSNEEIAKEVIADKWGTDKTNPTRKEQLTKAGYNYYDIQKIVNNMLKKTTYYPKCDENYKSLVDALKSINIESSFENRKKIAQNNGIKNYKGTSSQNIKLLNLLKIGKLKNG